MPELPEVETVKRGLTELIIGKTISNVSFDWPKGFPNAASDVERFLIGARVMGLRRRGKALMIDLSTNYTLVIHLKMTGQLVFRGSQVFGAGHPNESLIGELPDKSTRVTFSFSDDSHLYFNDQRKFGWVRLLPTGEVMNLPFFQKLGPEPLLDSFSSNNFLERLERRKNSGIKAVLLDQAVIAGVGNIYADESLFAAKIHPETLVKDVDTDRLKILFEELRRILLLAIEKGGSTDRNYVSAEGKRGSYLTFAKVFRREGEACEVCGNEIMKSRVAGRGTHTCSTCQPKPRSNRK